MPLPDHRTELAITDMVYARLPFLSRTDANATKISNLILEVMSELDVCFYIDETNDSEPPVSWVGDESKYVLNQRVVIADVVAVYLLIFKVVQETGGLATVDGDGTNEGKFLSKTKAGSVEVEWEQIDTKKGGGLTGSSEGLIKMYQESASRRGRAIGCTISWDLQAMLVECQRCRTLPPFIVGKFSTDHGAVTENKGRA